MRAIIFFLCCSYTHNLFAQDFSFFQLILNEALVETSLPNDGFQTAFDYKKAFNSPKVQEALKKQSQLLAQFNPNSLKDKKQATSFWINSYNFFMVKIILEQGFENGARKIDSVKDLGSFFSPYRIFTKKINNIGGTNYSLDQIEKDTLLGDEYKKREWKDARIHFAVNCASVGCPPLIKKIYTAENLDSLLDENIKKAFRTNRHLHFKDNTLYLTHLFKWYKSDFEEHSGSVNKFIEPYLENSQAIQKLKSSPSVKYIEYDWKLNRPGNF
jgi:hypothetical protein